jgi:hypothetical protein
MPFAIVVLRMNYFISFINSFFVITNFLDEFLIYMITDKIIITVLDNKKL